VSTPTSEGVTRRPTSEALAEFILSLVQAFLRTGYYLPDHPNSKKAKAGLYGRFQRLFSGRHELTFIVKDHGEIKEVLVDGPLPETTSLRSLMTQGMAEVYAPRLTKFFERKRLVSLTLKERMGEEEFSHFIDVMSEPTFVSLDSQAKDEFVAHLRRNGVQHISYVFMEDLVTDQRRLPWRAQLAISRLRKDIRMVPLFHHMEGAQIRNLHLQIVHDVLRPITKPELIPVMLLNSDLAHTPDLTDEEIENEIVNYIPESILIESCRWALKLHKERSVDRPEQDYKRALMKLYMRLRSTELTGAPELLRDFFDQGLVDIEMLPVNLKKRVGIERDTDRYLRERLKTLQLLDTVASERVYGGLSRLCIPVIEELVRRHLLEEALVLLMVYRAHAGLDGFRGRVASETLRELETGSLSKLLEEQFVSGKKEDRVALAPLFRALGESVHPYLLGIVRDSDNTWVRKNACEILVRVGAVDLLLGALRSDQLSAEAVAELLMVLEELGVDSPAVLRTLQETVKDPEPRVRAESAWALCRFLGSAEESRFIRLLDDPAIEVRKRAIRCLGHIESKAGLPHLVKILHRAQQDEISEPLEIEVYRALAHIPGASIDGHASAEDYLLSVLRESYPQGLKALIRRRRRHLSPGVFWAICDTLGAIGTPASIEVLAEINKQLGGSGRQKMEALMHQIESRSETHVAELSGVSHS